MTTTTTPWKEEHAPRELRPRIVLTAEDHARLSMLARAASASMPDVASALADELDRARVLAKGRHPEHIVRMGSEVEFRDDAGKVQTVTLVYPDEADISRGRISVLTPIGAALIGLRTESSITWHTRSGAIRRLTVLQVREPTSS
jgi:regulator of nucleoside diphosphate kinase